MYATDFQFDGELLSSYGLMICSFNGSGSTESVKNGADITLTTVKVPGSNTWNHVCGQYDEALTATFQIAKRTNLSQNPYFDAVEQRAINRFLNRADKFYPFCIIQDGFENIYFNVQINVNKIEFNGRVAGFELTVTTDKPYGYFKEQILTFQVPQNGSYSFVNLSDDIGRIPVSAAIKVLSSGTLDITNSQTGTTFSLQNCVENEVISFNSETKQITSNLPARTTAELLKNFNFQWLYISNTRDARKNTLTFSLPCEAAITYHPICKISF